MQTTWLIMPAVPPPWPVLTKRAPDTLFYAAIAQKRKKRRK